MRNDFVPIWKLAKETYSHFSADKSLQSAAALAFYTIFSLAPILIIVIAVAGLVWGRQAVRGEIVDQFSSTLGEGPARQIEELIKNANRPDAGIVASIVGVVTLLVGATALFAQLKETLNTVWGVQAKPGLGVWKLLLDRAISFAVVLAMVFVLLATLVASTAINALGAWASQYMPGPVPLVQALDLVVSFAIITVLFAAIFKWLPDVNIKWRDVWMGAVITALLFDLGKFALGWYLGRSSVSSVYGAAGSMIIILLWVYYASIIFLFGAEFTQVYARYCGAQIAPSKIAQFISAAQRARRKLTAAVIRMPEASARPAVARRFPRDSAGPRPTIRLSEYLTGLATAAVMEAWRARSIRTARRRRARNRDS